MPTFAAAAVLASRTTPLDPNDVKPGWLALGIVVVLCLATYVLCRSFLKHSRRASQHWDTDDQGPTISSAHDRRG